MQLNESTYETIFLLYIDNELSPKERMEVEAFIADNPSYALEMEALKATVLSAENMPYSFKENLKQQEWDTTYSTIIKEDLQAIPGLSTPFKNTLKKTTASEGIVVKSFGFKQNKFSYAAIAACLMLFWGYQQLTKTPASITIATNPNTLIVPTISTPSGETIISNSKTKQIASNIEPIAKTKQDATIKLQVSNSSNRSSAFKLQKETIAIAEPTRNNSILDNQVIISKLPSTYNNPISINATPLPATSTNIDTETTQAEKVSTSYEVIDTEDSNRTILIANFEIDGAAFRGITRRVSAFLKRNKSEKEK